MPSGSHRVLEQFVDDGLLFFRAESWEGDVEKLTNIFWFVRIYFAVFHGDIDKGIHGGHHVISVLPGRETVN